MTEPVGTVAEEMAKLMAALQSRLGDPGSTDDSADGEHHHVGDSENDDGAPECRWCPVCHGIRYARSLSPEVREHLGSAAVSMALAVKAMLDGVGEPRPSDEEDNPLEKISLVED